MDELPQHPLVIFGERYAKIQPTLFKVSGLAVLYRGYSLPSMTPSRFVVFAVLCFLLYYGGSLYWGRFSQWLATLLVETAVAAIRAILHIDISHWAQYQLPLAWAMLEDWHSLYWLMGLPPMSNPAQVDWVEAIHLIFPELALLSQQHRRRVNRAHAVTVTAPAPYLLYPLSCILLE